MSDRLNSALEESFYGNCAGLYDLVATAPGVRSWRSHTAASLSRGDTVVEMGCGTGANFPYLRERVGSEGCVVGVDLVSAMLGQAKRRIERAGWENVHVVQGDATRPPVENADAVVSTFVVGMLEDPGEAVRTWIRCVEPGGRVTLLNAARSPHLLAFPLNLALRLFVRSTAPGHQFRLSSPVRVLEQRWDKACDALFEGTVDHHTERLGFGLVPLASGRVPSGP